MPFELRLDKEYDLVRNDLRGKVTSSDLLEAIIQARDVVSQARPQLWDARKATDANLDDDVIVSLQELVKLRIEHGVVIRGKRAFVTPSAHLRSIAEVIAGEFDDLGVEIRAFGREQAALDWLLGR